MFRAPVGTARSPSFTVLGVPNEQGVARLGLAVSRRQARRAVDRNRIKRLVRETFRERQGRLGGVDLVVIARGGARQATGAELRSVLGRQLERVAEACRQEARASVQGTDRAARGRGPSTGEPGIAPDSRRESGR